MKSKFCISGACRIYLLSVVFLFAFVALSPQQVFAKIYSERAVPVSEGDPEDGWDNSSGAGGGLLPPEEENRNFTGREIYSLNNIPFYLGNNSVGMLVFTPFLDGKPLVWFITVLPVQGGLN